MRETISPQSSQYPANIDFHLLIYSYLFFLPYPGYSDHEGPEVLTRIKETFLLVLMTHLMEFQDTGGYFDEDVLPSKAKD